MKKVLPYGMKLRKCTNPACGFSEGTYLKTENYICSRRCNSKPREIEE